MRHPKFIIAVIAALLVGSTSANAQFYLGGGLGFGSTNDKFHISISPDLGYNLTNHFAVGGRLSYDSGVNRFGVTPYARLNILKRESLIRLMANLEAPFKWASNYSSRGIYLRPGLSVRVAPNIRIEGLFGYFGWGSVTSEGSTSNGWQYTIGSNSTSLGVVIGL